MRNAKTGEPLPFSFERMNVSEPEGVNVHFQGSNLEPDEYPQILQTAIQTLAAEANTYIEPKYFASSVHEMSNISAYERYVRINRNWSQKFVGRTGIMHRLLQLCATEKGSKFELRVDNEGIVGKNQRARLPKQDAGTVISGHGFGKQLKHYHPEYVRKKNEHDPLYHPKIGVLANKKLTGYAAAWENRQALRREIDELLINTLYWSDIPVRPDPTTYIQDEHFEVRAAADPVKLRADPTPEIEANQDALLVTVLSDLCDSDVEVLESLVTDGAEQHPHELALNTERGISTIYRVLSRLQGLIRNDNATVSFESRKFEQEIAGIVESTEYQIRNAADRAARILNLETRQASSSAWQKWCTKYAAKIVEITENGERTIRIDTVLSRLKSAPCPTLKNVLQEAIDAWRKDGGDPLDIRNATVRWRTGPDSFEVGVVGPTLR